MTHPSPSTIAKRAFYEAMKAGGESEAMWIAAADAVIEECAKVADSFCEAPVLGAGSSAEIDIATSHALSCARAIRALKGNANG